MLRGQLVEHLLSCLLLLTYSQCFRVSLAIDTDARDDATRVLKAYLQSAVRIEPLAHRHSQCTLTKQPSQTLVTNEQYAAAAHLYAVEVTQILQIVQSASA